MADRLRIDLVTGFLGAGKTTFIIKYRDYLRAAGEKAAVIENEFCGYDVDSQILAETGECPISLAGECMCCTGREHFKELLIRCAEEGLDRVIVEPSGIYEVREFFSVLDSEKVKECCEPGSILTVFDPAFLSSLTPETEELMVSQILSSGMLILSKSALYKEEEVAEARTVLEQLLSDYGVQTSIFSKDWELLDSDDFKAFSTCGCRRISYGDQPAVQHNQVFSTLMLKGDFPTAEMLKEKLRLIFHGSEYGRVLRVKGYMKDAEGTVWLVNCTPDLSDFRKCSRRRGILVLIGNDLDEAGIRSVLSYRRDSI